MVFLTFAWWLPESPAWFMDKGTEKCLAFPLKEQCQEIFYFRFFSQIIFPQALDSSTNAILSFFRKFWEIFAT
jgi:hypothetical protein